MFIIIKNNYKTVKINNKTYIFYDLNFFYQNKIKLKLKLEKNKNGGQFSRFGIRAYDHG